MRWLRRILRFRAPLWVYAAAFFGPLAIAALATVLAIATGAPTGRVAGLQHWPSCSSSSAW